MTRHTHEPRWTMGRYPVAATCKGCDMVLIANGGGWQTRAKADQLKAQQPMARMARALRR
jgi:hypothetical protein